ncbi:MAG: DNA/RNA helicase domain-containing protein [Bacteroidota bacterium]
MIIYQESKKTFVQQVKDNLIEYSIDQIFQEKLGRRVGNSERKSWRNSLQYMENILDEEIPSDAQISIEYKVPNTSKRIDFIISGQDKYHKDCAVIIELKQWENANATDKDAIVTTKLQGSVIETIHPSYQAWTYKELLEGFNEAVYKQNIILQACAYLHNCENAGELNSKFYSYHIERAPLFIRSDVKKLRSFIKEYIKYGDVNGVMYCIENGRIRPSKTIADNIKSMIDGNDVFTMIDDQKLVYETILNLSKQATSSKKKVIIITGGPGTGKSVVAVQLTANITAERKLVQYVSKNSAPRDVYAYHLSGHRTKSWINNLFKSSGSYINARSNEFDVLIIDEAHRLNLKSGFYGNEGENQIKEIIKASKCSVFFIDEDQRVTLKDIGTSESIELCANELSAEITYLKLESQFRCNGSDGYIAWLDNLLGIRSTANESIDDLNYSFTVVSSPNELREKIEILNTERNRARIVAGYCWPWNSKKDTKAMDIVIDDFSMQWNLAVDGSLWIVSPDSVKQVGCIHTCQGLEVDYIGVIVGNDLVIRNNKWVCQPDQRDKHDKSIKGWKKLLKDNPHNAKNIIDTVIKNTYRTLMTRGMKGCIVYSTDPETREWLNRRILNN